MNFYVYTFTWTSQIFYLICQIPQIYKNYKRKSAEGLSDLFLLAFLHGYGTGLLYIFGLNLPPAYKLIVPFAAIATLVIIGQRIIYADAEHKKHLWFLYLSNIAIYLPLIPWVMHNPTNNGAVAGWINLGINSINLLPQIFKIHFNKSVNGFSYSFTLILALGGFCELVAAYLLNLPPQSFFNGLKNIIMYFILTIQFSLYRNAKP
jgi:uncharacterized protein with PQ loop repeat